jgi:hypothetical protein
MVTAHARVIVAGLVLICALGGCDGCGKRYFLWRHRNNPNCTYHEDCLSMGCPPPNGVFCHWRGDGSNKGVCVCQRWGLMPGDLAGDAGLDNARDGGQPSEARDR